MRYMKRFEVFDEGYKIAEFYWDEYEESYFGKMEEVLYILQEIEFPSWDRKKLIEAIHNQRAIFTYHNTEKIEVTWSLESQKVFLHAIE